MCARLSRIEGKTTGDPPREKKTEGEGEIEKRLKRVKADALSAYYVIERNKRERN